MEEFKTICGNRKVRLLAITDTEGVKLHGDYVGKSFHSYSHLLEHGNYFVNLFSSSTDYIVEIPLAQLLETCPCVSSAAITQTAFSLYLGLLSNPELRKFLFQLATDARLSRSNCRTARDLVEQVDMLIKRGEALLAEAFASRKEAKDVIQEATSAFRKWAVASNPLALHVSAFHCLPLLRWAIMVNLMSPVECQVLRTAT